jgi:hypothetical protein
MMTFFYIMSEVDFRKRVLLLLLGGGAFNKIRAVAFKGFQFR